MNQSGIKVFVSSSSKDMLTYRAAVRDVLLSMDLSPVMMEYFPVNVLTGTKTSLNFVEESDIFLLIIGWRYGLPTPGNQISVTELEYEAGLRANLPIIAYLADESTREDPARFGFDPAHINTWSASTDPQSPWTWQSLSDKLAAFRSRVSVAHLIKRYTGADQLATFAATDLHYALTGYKTKRLVEGAGTALAQRDFTQTRQLAQATLDALPVNAATPENQEMAAQAHFLLALGLLNGTVVTALPYATFREIETHLKQAMLIAPLRGSYQYVLGDLYLKMSGPFPTLAHEGQRLLQAAYALPADTCDGQNVAFYDKAKPQN